MRKQDEISSESGFTLTELLSVIVVTTLFVGLISYFGFNYWRYSSVISADLDSFVSRLNSQDVVRELIGTASGLSFQNSIADANTHDQDPTQLPGFWAPLHAVPGTTTLGSSGYTPLL